MRFRRPISKMAEIIVILAFPHLFFLAILQILGCSEYLLRECILLPSMSHK